MRKARRKCRMQTGLVLHLVRAHAASRVQTRDRATRWTMCGFSAASYGIELLPGSVLIGVGVSVATPHETTMAAV
jgi:hypothetical protein